MIFQESLKVIFKSLNLIFTRKCFQALKCVSNSMKVFLIMKHIREELNTLYPLNLLHVLHFVPLDLKLNILLLKFVKYQYFTFQAY